MNAETSRFKKNAAPWIPFAFCLFLCGIVMFFMLTTGDITPALPAFFCFLPMTFLYMALALVQQKKEIQQLSRKIAQLEEEKK